MNPRSIRKLISIFWFSSFFLFYPAAASGQPQKQTHKEPGWDDKIIAGSRVTLLELAARVIPDININENKSYKVIGKDVSKVRLLDGIEETGMELDLEAGDEHEFTSVDYSWLRERDEKLLVLILTADIERPVIALFRITPKIALLDAVTLAQDAHVTVDVGNVWTIHPQHQAFVVQCWHDNSSESFDNYTFVSIVRHKLRAIAGPIVSSGFTEYSARRGRVCKTSMTPTFKFVLSNRRGNQGYRDLAVEEMTLKVCHRDSEQWSWKTGVVSRKSVRRAWGWSPEKQQYRKISGLRKSG